MKKFIKQLLCGHVYKETDTTFLEKVRLQNGNHWHYNLPTYADFNKYGVTKECLKCKKEAIDVKLKLIIFAPLPPASNVEIAIEIFIILFIYIS